MAGSFRGGQAWDPGLLLAQLATVQGLFYAGLASLLALLDAATGTDRSLDQLFRAQAVYLRDTGGAGRVVAAAFLLNAVLVAGGLWAVVGRAKLCLDFAVSAHLVHALAVWLRAGSPPLSASWWLLQALSAGLATLLAEFLCMRSEMRAIPVGAFASARSDL